MENEWVIGRRAVMEALKAGRSMGKLLVAEGAGRGKGGLGPLLEEARRQGVDVQQVPRQTLDRVAAGLNHQGVAAQAEPWRYAELEELFQRAEERDEPPFILLLDGIEDPHNLGSILRTADASGVHGVVIPKRRAAGLTPTVAKTSAGAVEHVPVVRVTNLNRTADELKERGVWLVAGDADASARYDEMDYSLPVALVIGNEGKGVSRRLKEKCDFTVGLPMKGAVSSLNASVAAALLMYEVLRGREK
ncbi:23S rRNA (guanosine(2251)-2'-O)-methyltransferase RlmB [Kroppenstedtia eburnea]|uniref:23S rRNA (Guanosine2251-2'-O)-methyltransferase n=1 Tax=Kroppenstedtia eburnea TaxID=714067 RepID=A0A1N7MYQ0_9BACL|nr:23S rRNA (guanosine(2251)-2'-O)-methyltransferase RlmB [Kroppenstedtia eburnea]EGK09709.1 RNA methyltransferase [Desmospora sp. 8437]QKI80739.1 23S rRNA (guanosine(2251)-2'-O)-methyltransferase RlmB [Kroppenstedtia eburnea]SIS91284.1 23S rRNA (guanosine2251-2'-O)-methyltransferase [Kroppenstedtia eburnea]